MAFIPEWLFHQKYCFMDFNFDHILLFIEEYDLIWLVHLNIFSKTTYVNNRIQREV